MTATVLERILAQTREEVRRRKQAMPLRDLPVRPAAAPAPGAGGRLAGALRAPGIGVIAEFKRRSPSAGKLAERPRLADVVAAYERGGAVALSVLTEEPNFEGTLQDLGAARATSTLPLLRKDFIVDPYQLQEALIAGADAVLLIVAALDDAELAALHARALELGLDALVEVHDSEELARALAAGASIVGINNRDLRDFSVDVGRTAQLMEEVPADVLAVSESGIGEPEQLRELAALGVRAVLVGERLMRAADPAAELRRLRGEPA